MAGATGGSIVSASIRGRTFSVASDADVTIKLGGYENEKKSNGDSTARTVKMMVTWAVTGLVLTVDPIKGDQEFLQEVADNNEDVDNTITLANGQVLQGVGTITDAIEFSTQNSTATVSLGGGGKLTQQ
jgi:hypothetical protein